MVSGFTPQYLGLSIQPLLYIALLQLTSSREGPDHRTLRVPNPPIFFHHICPSTLLVSISYYSTLALARLQLTVGVWASYLLSSSSLSVFIIPRTL